MNSHIGAATEELNGPRKSTRAARWGLALLVCFMATVIAPRKAQAQADLSKVLPIVRIHDQFTVDALGNAEGHAEIVLPTAVYHVFKLRMSPREIIQENGKQRVKLHEPKIDNVLRYLGLNNVSYEMEHIDGSFDDDAALIHVNYRVLGRAKNRRGHWQMRYAADLDHEIKVSRFQAGKDKAEIEFRKLDNGIRIINRVTATFPKGTKKIRMDNEKLELNYDAPPPTGSKNQKAESRPRFELDAKPQIMSALYKLYGNPGWDELWVARSLFRNTTAETLKDYRVRFRLNSHSTWSPWKRCDTVYPGQLVPDPFYPVIDHSITELNGSSLALVEVEYEYVRPDGKKIAEVESARIKLLGMNDALWSDYDSSKIATWFDRFRNAPHLIAAFSTPNDPVIHDVVGMVSKATGGLNATGSDEQAMVFLGTLYNLLRQNISYEGAAGGDHGSKHFQYLKYGRDVLRTRSGTCINLSIFYASVCEAAGLEPYIVLVPGHAFVGIKLPASKQDIFVETTLCGGGTKETSSSFHFALESALKKYQESQLLGFFYEIDLKNLHKKGVNSPELPRIGSNPLKDWDIKIPEKAELVTSPKLFVAVRTALENNKFTYDRAGATGLTMAYTGKEGKWEVILQTFEQANFVLFLSRMTQPIPEAQRPALFAEFAKLNSNSVHGNFELDKEGRICFRTTTDVTGGTLSETMVISGINFHLNIMRKQAPLLAHFTAANANGTVLAAQTRPKRAPQQNVPAVQGNSLVGRWAAQFSDGTQQYVQVIEFHKDGSYATAAQTSGGETDQGQGTYTYANGIVQTTRSNGAINRGQVKWTNANQWSYVTQEYRIDYHREKN